MKISKSKQELARIISENGGWRDGAEWAAQDKNHAGRLRKVVFYCGDKPWFEAGEDYWGGNNTHDEFIISDRLIKSWHQTILSRDEYFHLYPVLDADGWIEWNGGECPVDAGTIVDVKHRDGDIGIRCHAGMSSSEPDCEGTATAEDWSHLDDGGDIIAYRLHKPGQVVPEYCESVMRSIPEPSDKPTIEQLAADYRNAKDYAERKQQEAYAAKADADEKLRVLELAGEALGLLVSPITAKQEPELVITDWRDLQVGDIIEYVDGGIKDKIGMTGPVVEFAPDATDGMMVRMKCDNGPRKGRLGWPMKWRFIRRP